MHVSALVGQRGAMTPEGSGRDAQHRAPPLKFLESCVSESKEMSMVVISPVGLLPGMYEDARRAGASFVCFLANPGPGFLFHYWA